MSDLDFTFKMQQWPPPEDRKHMDRYLIGFDEDRQPYIVKWNPRTWASPDTKGAWHVTTFSHGATVQMTDVLAGAKANKIKMWADAPKLWSELKREV
jgi:hypothetical protein